MIKVLTLKFCASKITQKASVWRHYDSSINEHYPLTYKDIIPWSPRHNSTFKVQIMWLDKRIDRIKGININFLVNLQWQEKWKKLDQLFIDDWVFPRTVLANRFSSDRTAFYFYVVLKFHLLIKLVINEHNLMRPCWC